MKAPLSLANLPSFPLVAVKVLNLLSRPDVETKEVVQVIATDASFTAELLSVANSPLFGLPQQVKTPRLAAVLLGQERLKRLTATAAMRSFLKAPLRDPLFQRCWKHSLASALLSEGLAHMCALYCPEAYTGGLLHAIGSFGMMMTLPKEDYARLIHCVEEEHGDVIQCEQSLFGLDHCEVGALLMSKWGLPKDLISAAKHHHDEPHAEGRQLDALVHVGCQLASTLGFYLFDSSQHRSVAEILTRLPGSRQDDLLLTPDVLRAAVGTRIDSMCW